MTADDTLAPLIATLAAQARKHMEARREADRVLGERLELRAALARFGVSGAGHAVSVERDDPSALDLTDRAHLQERVERELGRLARFARSRDPRYDLNRHILIARLLRWLRGAQPWIRPAESVPGDHAAPRSALSSRPGSRSHKRTRRSVHEPKRTLRTDGRKRTIAGPRGKKRRTCPECGG